MTKNLSSVCALVALGAVCGSASAAIVFSDVQISGTLSAGATYDTALGHISFNFPNALVSGAGAGGTLDVTFVAEGTAGEKFNAVALGLFGAVSGGGAIFYSEDVYDQTVGMQ